MSRKTKGNILLLITALCWGSGFAIRKIGTAAIPPMTFNALRELVGAVMLIPLLSINLKQTKYFAIGHNRHSVLDYRKKKVAIASVVCGSLFTVASMLQSLGLATVSAGKSGFITSMYVVLTPLIAMFLGTKISRKSAGCIVLAVIGFAFLSLSGGIGSINMESVFSVLIGAIVLGEVMSFREIFGCALILIAVLFNQIDSRIINKLYEKKTKNNV